jgi:hypothetical protein
MLLWRESRRHCECGRVGSRWIAHLYFEDVVVEECSFDLLGPMLRMAHAWRTAVTSNPAAVVFVNDAQCANADARRVGGAESSPPTRPTWNCPKSAATLGRIASWITWPEMS